MHAIGSKAALAAVVGGMWLGRPLGGVVVFAAVAAGGSHIHIHLRRAGGLAWAWAGSFAVGGIGRTADAVFWMRK